MKPLFQKIAHVCKEMFLPKEAYQAKSSRKEHYKATPAERQKMLEDSCEALFERQDLITSGKLQMLGTQQIQQKFSHRWPYIQQAVHGIIVSILKSHLSDDDVFFRFRDEGYVILFSEKNQEEAHATLTAIAYAIRQALIENEERVLQEIAIEKKVGHLYANKMKDKKITPESLNSAFEEAPENDVQEKAPELEVELEPAKPKAPPAPPPPEKKTPASKLNPCYMPLCAPANMEQVNMYMLLAQGKSAGDNPFDKHQMFFLGMGQNQKHEFDLEFLNLASATLEHMFANSLMYQIICPIHFETLTNVKAFEKFIIECQKIPDAQKSKLIFCIQNFPSEFNAVVVRKSLSQLRPHCASLAAILHNYKTVNVESFVDLSISIAGYRIKNAQMTAHDKILDSMQDFVSKIKKNRIHTVFALDMPKMDDMELPQILEYGMVSGQEIHPNCTTLEPGDQVS